MNAWPESTTVERFLVRVRHRLLLLRAVEGFAVGAGVAALLMLAAAPPVAGIATVVLLAALTRVALGDRWRFGWWRSLPAIAQRLERRTAVGRNLIVTAAELPTGARGYVPDAVMARAARIVDGLEVAKPYPARPPLIALFVGTAMLAMSFLRPAIAGRVIEVLPFRAAVPSVRQVEVTVVPPGYTGIARSTLVNPSRIEALAASRIEVRVTAHATSVGLETVSGTQTMAREGDAFSTTLTAESDGFLAIEPRDSTGAPGPRQLIGLAVTPDRPPRVTLTSPGRDLFFSNVPGSIPVTINADDDIALSSVRLRYTAVSGTGERFTFIERDVPVSISRQDPRTWTARGTWRLDSLNLAPGDLVVYRAVATDKRPGAPPVESESYVLEVVTPGAIAAEGFAADDQRDRYAVSQQMVILRTERLLSRRASIPADSVQGESRLLAAEQRSVRAEFVFMMGGELEDIAGDAAGTLDLNEVAEAEAEGDLLAGRQQNQGRVDMMRAIRAMSRASTALTESNLDVALQQERAALDNLMRAFARSRFILRALTQRERIDLERRLSGALNMTAGLSAPVAMSVPDERTVALRRLLADVASMASADASAVASARRATVASLDLLRTDPSSDTLRVLAGRVQRAASLVAGGSTNAARVQMDSLLEQVSALLASSLPAAPAPVGSLESHALDGALRDALRRTGRRP